jgi:hypothetical protein
MNATAMMMCMGCMCGSPPGEADGLVRAITAA